MDRREFIAAAGIAAAVASASKAFAQDMDGAVFDHAIPSVGQTVSGSPREVKLYFTKGVIAASSSVLVMSPTGAMVAASKPANDPSDQQIVIVRLKRALPPGIYKVSWHVVSLDGRPASGTFQFTIS